MRKILSILAVGIIFSLVSSNVFAAVIQHRGEKRYYNESGIQVNKDGSPINFSEFNITEEYQPVKFSENQAISGETARDRIIRDASEGRNMTNELLREGAKEPIVLFDFEKKTKDFFAESNMEGIEVKGVAGKFGLCSSASVASVIISEKESRDGNCSLKLVTTDVTADLKIPINFSNINTTKHKLGFSTKAADWSMGGVNLKVSFLNKDENIIVHSGKNLYDLSSEWRDHWTYLGNIPNVEEATYIRLCYKTDGSGYLSEEKGVYVDRFVLKPLSEEEIQQELLKTLAKIPDVAETPQPKKKKNLLWRGVDRLKKLWPF